MFHTDALILTFFPFEDRNHLYIDYFSIITVSQICICVAPGHDDRRFQIAISGMISSNVTHSA